MALTKEEALMVDHQKARDYIDKYKTAVTNGFIARVAILTGAIQDFNSFRDLPPSSDRAAAIWDVAFSIVSVAVPALKLGEFFKKQYERADAALKRAEAVMEVGVTRIGARVQTAATRADKVTRIVTKKVEQAGEAAKYANEVKGILDKAKVVEKYKGQVEQHASRGPIQALVKDLYEAPKTWEKVIDLETQEWENRLADLPAQGTLLQLVQRHLTLPEQLDEEEIRKMYLFEMVLAYCKTEVYWEDTITDWGYGQYTHDYELKGINDNQQDQIMEWFGPGSKRGPYFKRPPIFMFPIFLSQWSVREVVKRRSQTADIRAKV